MAASTIERVQPVIDLAARMQPAEQVKAGCPAATAGRATRRHTLHGQVTSVMSAVTRRFLLLLLLRCAAYFRPSVE
jgi:hypothetical protein